jgi:modulator of FtsH protease
VGLATSVIVGRSAILMVQTERGHRPWPSTTARVALAAIQVLPFVVGAVLLIADSGAGVVWIAAGVLLVFVGSVTNAWVLLVEILR